MKKNNSIPFTFKYYPETLAPKIGIIQACLLGKIHYYCSLSDKNICTAEDKTFAEAFKMPKRDVQTYLSELDGQRPKRFRGKIIEGETVSGHGYIKRHTERRANEKGYDREITLTKKFWDDVKKNKKLSTNSDKPQPDFSDSVQEKKTLEELMEEAGVPLANKDKYSIGCDGKLKLSRATY